MSVHEDLPADVVEYEEVQRLVAEMRSSREKLDRIELFLKSKRDAYARRLEYLERQVEKYAIRFRLETGTSVLPVVGGSIRVAKRRKTIERNVDELARYAKAAGLEGNPDFERRTWRFDQIAKRAVFRDGVAVDRQTGEIIPGLVEKVPGPEEFTVSIKLKGGPDGEDQGE